MAVNSFNPRLFSSSSSENDVEDVYRHKAGAVAPVDVTLPSAKSRCFSEPAGHQNGKEGKKEEGRSFGKTPALSDSSNVLKRHKGRLALQNGNEKPSVAESKNELYSPISEESSSQSSPDNEKSKSDSVFPEPESGRRDAGKDYRYSFHLEDVQSLGDGLVPNGRGQDLGEGAGIMEFPDELQQINGMENDEVFMREMGVNGVADVNADDQQVLDEDDDSYPEKESYPPDYASCFLGDLPYISYPWDLPRTVLRSCSALDLENAPQLPDDLIKDTTSYPDIDFDSLSPAVVPSPFTPPDCEMKMRQFFAEDY